MRPPLPPASLACRGVYYGRARNAISQLTTELPLDGSTEQQVADFLRGVYIASLVILIVLIALAVGLMLLRGMQRARQNPNCAGCGECCRCIMATSGC